MVWMDGKTEEKPEAYEEDSFDTPGYIQKDFKAALDRLICKRAGKATPYCRLRGRVFGWIRGLFYGQND